MRISVGSLHKIPHVRVKGALLIVGLTAVIASYFCFFFDYQVKEAIEDKLSRLHGAKISIGTFRTSILTGRVTLKNILVANPETPMKNLFEIDSVQFQISTGPLLRKKVLIEDMKISGIHYGTQRETPGINLDELESENEAFTLMDRAHSGIYASVKNESLDIPLRHLGQLGMGLNIRVAVEALFDNLKSVQHLKKLKETVQSRTVDWEQARNDLPSTRYLGSLKNARSLASIPADENGNNAPLSERLVLAKNHYVEIQQEVAKAQKELEKLPVLVREDIPAIRRQLNLPRTDFDDLTHLAFGPRWLGILERVSYWIDLSRRIMPAGVDRDGYMVTVRESFSGPVVHFDKPGALPTFLLRKIDVESGTTDTATQLSVKGEIFNLTSDPTVHGHPVSAHLRVNYPQENLTNLEISLNLNHVKKSPKDRINFSVESFKVKNWAIAQTSDLKLALGDATATLKADATFEGDSLDLTWDADLKDVHYIADSRFTQLEQILHSLVTGVENFSLTGKIEGKVNELKFETTSGLGHKLADGLKHEFRHQFGAIDDNIFNQTNDSLPPIKNEIVASLRHHRDNTLPAFQKAIREMEQAEKHLK